MCAAFVPLLLIEYFPRFIKEKLYSRVGAGFIKKKKVVLKNGCWVYQRKDTRNIMAITSYSENIGVLTFGYIDSQIWLTMDLI